jgi:type I restriction enzyme M protein
MSICDPTCGSGGFLVECARQIQQRRGDVHQVSFYGQEVSSHIWVFAQINMLLHDIPNFDIRQGNTIREPKLVKDGVFGKINSSKQKPTADLAAAVGTRLPTPVPR